MSAGERRLRLLCSEKVELIIAQCVPCWKQRGKFCALCEGDANTRYFHAKASGRVRRNTIRAIEVDGAQLVAHQDKVSALTAYYNAILGGEADTTWGFDVEHLYMTAVRADTATLLAPFSKGEALGAVRAMSANSASGPDGVGPRF